MRNVILTTILVLLASLSPAFAQPQPNAWDVFIPVTGAQTLCGPGGGRAFFNPSAPFSLDAGKRRYGECFGGGPLELRCNNRTNFCRTDESAHAEIQQLLFDLAVCKRFPFLTVDEMVTKIQDIGLTIGSLQRLRTETMRCKAASGGGGTGMGGGSGTGSGSGNGSGTQQPPCPAGQTCQGPCPVCPPPSPVAAACEPRTSTELPPEDVDLVIWGRRWGVFVARRMGNVYWLDSGAKWEAGDVLRWLVLPVVD